MSVRLGAHPGWADRDGARILKATTLLEVRLLAAQIAAETKLLEEAIAENGRIARRAREQAEEIRRLTDLARGLRTAYYRAKETIA